MRGYPADQDNGVMVMRREWWENIGVPKPVFVAKTRKYSVLSIVSSTVAIVLVLIVFLATAFSPEISMFIAGILLLTQGLTAFVKLLTPAPGELELEFARNLLKGLNGKILAWSIPSKDVLIACKLVNGIHLYYFITRFKKGQVLVGRPVVFSKIVKKPKLRIHEIRTIRSGKGIEISRFDVSLPRPDNPRIWCRTIFRGILLSQKKTSVKQLLDIIEKL